ncbi:MATE family efflux transporter [Bacteroidales bacterium OttesenSCG-928-B11]|nr:MATE family efflux transporter [Bacteroidales bacterium OttesenSCG-928-C03]MDL2313242.1 MATE family efflux transporter [Bacteroidales bacterium OttesenSCG-928-B11]MDL2326949.1 MATE family efflux transporter [Bacteroidales bacterium OttesenSCG-928-A14]
MRKNSLPTTLGTDSISSLLKQYAIPAIIAMTAASLYNITDSIFIGHGVGAMAISGLAITFPLMNLASAFGALVGVGGATLLSIRLGQKDYATANVILGNVLVLNVIIGIAFSVITLPFLDPILRFFGASEELLPYARDYMLVILFGNVVTHTYMGLNTLIRSAGNPEKSMFATICSVLINIPLNAIFIFGLDMGIKGSAIATILSQAAVLCWQVKFFSNKNYYIHFSKGIYKLQKNIVKGIFSIGSASFFMNAAACLIVILINKGLREHGGDLAVGAYGIVNRVAFLFLMIVMGFTQGLQPIAGYNFGAKKYDRLNKVLKLTIFWATAVMCFGFLVAEIFPRAVTTIFTTDTELVDLSANGLRIVFMFFPFVGFQMVVSTFFQSIGEAGKAIFLSLSRQLIFLLPLLIILPQFFGLNGVWFSLPISDFIATITASVLLYLQYKKWNSLEKQ